MAKKRKIKDPWAKTIAKATRSSETKVRPEVQVVRRIETEISLNEFRDAVAKSEGLNPFMVSADYTGPAAKSAIYKAEVTRVKDNSRWLYLLIPKVENGHPFFAITRRRIDRKDEGSFIDLFGMSGVTVDRVSPLTAALRARYRCR